MDKVKIQEIADEAGLSNGDLLEKAKELGFNVVSAMSTITMEDAGILVDYAISGTLPRGYKKTRSKTKTKVVKKKADKPIQKNIEKDAGKSKPTEWKGITVIPKNDTKIAQKIERIKIRDIARELGISDKVVLEKAKELDFDVKSIYSSLGTNDISTLKEYVVDGVLPKGFKPIIKKPKVKEKKQQVEIESKTEITIPQIKKRDTKLNDINRIQTEKKRKESTTRQKLDELRNDFLGDAKKTQITEKVDNKVQPNKKRKFELPLFERLNKEQSAILRLPENGRYLIFGGPGTGKSVVALLRSKKYHVNNDYQFLVYNHVLNTATFQQINKEINLKSWTLLSWFWIHMTKIFGYGGTPTMPYNNRQIDYEAIIHFLQDEEKFKYIESSLHIIIDEGQDMPKGFYDVLWHLGIVNFFVVADQNQQITSDNSTRKDLINILSLERENVIELKQNFRNTDRIALFAQHFFTDPSVPPPDIPYEKASFDTPTLYDYSYIEDCVRLILRTADKNPQHLVGVIVLSTESRQKYVSLLNTYNIQLDNKRPEVSTYDGDEKIKNVGKAYQNRSYNRIDNFTVVSPKTGMKSVDIDFSEGGIVVITDKSVKGLEFDVVFIIVDDFSIINNDQDSMKKRFYVMSSRAMEKLVLLKDKNYSGNIETILPNDETILKRESL